jgi:hypothetical protein
LIAVVRRYTNIVSSIGEQVPEYVPDGVKVNFMETSNTWGETLLSCITIDFVNNQSNISSIYGSIESSSTKIQLSKHRCTSGHQLTGEDTPTRFHSPPNIDQKKLAGSNS